MARKPRGKGGGDYTMEDIAEALRKNGGYRTMAAKTLGCTYQTVLNYIETFAELQELVAEIKEQYTDMSEAVVVKTIQSGVRRQGVVYGTDKDGNRVVIAEDNPTDLEVKTALQYLRYHGRERGYIDRQEITTPGNKPLMIGVEFVAPSDTQQKPCMQPIGMDGVSADPKRAKAKKATKRGKRPARTKKKP